MRGAARRRSSFCRPSLLGVVVVVTSVLALAGAATAGVLPADDGPLPPTARFIKATPRSLSFAWRLQSRSKSVIGYGIWLDGDFCGGTRFKKPILKSIR